MVEDDFSIELDDSDEPNDGTLSATTIAQYIRFNCCPRFFKLRLDRYPCPPISPLLSQEGNKLEEKTTKLLEQKTGKYLDFSKYDPKYIKNWEPLIQKSMDSIKELVLNQIALGENADQRPVLVYQVPMYGTIGVWTIKGTADLIAIWPLKDGKVKVRIFELKASWQEQTAHRIQVAIYMLLLGKQLADLSSKVELEGGVINSQTKLDTLAPDLLPRFKESPLIQDVKRLLAKSGELNRIRCKSIDKIEYQICWRCDNCGFNDCCIAYAIENKSIALLNLSRGEQSALNRHGIITVDDLAKLRYPVNEFTVRPYDFKPALVREPEKILEISTDPIVGAKLNWLIERSQYMLTGIQPSSPYASKSRWMPWLTGSGYGSLPDDSPSSEFDKGLMIKPNSLVRVYLFIEWDYLLEVISVISARVSCTSFKGKPLNISRVIEALPDNREDCLALERKMLEEFFVELTQSITKVANEIGCPDVAPIHLYFFTRHERDVLMEAVRNHDSLLSARAIRDLLGLRQAIDQPMFSIIQDEIQYRKALKFPSSGLLPILDQAGFFDFTQWQDKRKDGSIVNLKSTFYLEFFSYARSFSKKPDGSVHILTKDEPGGVGYYPAHARFGDQLPIEYIWGVKGRLDNLGGSKKALEKYKWCDSRNRRITDEDICLMGQKLCLAIEHIERSLNIRNKYLGKKPIPIPTIATFSLGPATLERSCREFLDLEYFSKRQEMYQQYTLLPFQRVSTGKSLIFQCTQVEESEEEFIVNGKLIYEGVGMPKGDCILNACRVKGSDESSSGDWMIVTELRLNEQGQFEVTETRGPSEIAKSARAIVSKVNVPKLEITLKVVNWPRSRGSKYTAWHNLPTTDPEKAQKQYMQFFGAGRYYILDELADDIISDRAAECLDSHGNNVLYNLLADYLASKNGCSAHVALSQASAEPFLTWIKKRKNSPKVEQERFIEQIFSKKSIIMLQGPPGTGKTETLQLAVLTHIAAHRATCRCHVLMVAPTHKAIQEFVAKLSRCWDEYTNQGGKDLKDLRIYRALSSDINNAPILPGVKYFNYHDDEGTVKELSDCLLNQVSLTAHSTIAAPIVLCLTPHSLYALMKKIGDKEPPWGAGFFDLLVVDEASMMRVPELILSGGFLTKNSQILIAGDHRQLPPIVAHNWEKEDRRTLEEMAAFLSAMDFLRLLRNEDLGIERLKRKSEQTISPDEIPTVRLSESHRCHSVVAEFLREWVYEKDKIDFHSDRKEILPAPNAKTDGLAVALEPENVFVLVVHDEAESFQSNLTEAAIVNALVRSAPTDKVGIITPHNAQKGLLKNLLPEGCKDTRVDTVERYQGGEADFVIISTCVSDPDYVRTESEFLLNLNRINVAISRMKKKLVIVASRSIFEFMPQDARDYDKALLWRGISETVGFTADSVPDWAGSLSEFIGSDAAAVKVEVYVKSTESQ